MLSVEKFNTVKNVVEGIIDTLHTKGLLLPKEPLPEDTSIVDWIFNHIKQLELDEETIDEIEKAYYQLINDNQDFLQVAQSFFADAVFIQRIQSIQGNQPDPITLEVSDKIAIIINSMWGMIAYFPFLIKYLRTKEDWLEDGARTFIFALIVNVQAQIRLGRTVEKIQGIVHTVGADFEERILN